MKNLTLLQPWEITQNINITIHLLTLYPRKYQEELSDINADLGLAKNQYLSLRSVNLLIFISMRSQYVCISPWTKFQHRNV